MLENGAVATRLPAQDLERARAFYAEKLGLEPAEERPGGLLYRCPRGEFALFQTDGAPYGSHTQMAWQVDDIEAVAAQLRARGVVFEDYDMPGWRRPAGSRRWPETIRARAVSVSGPRGSKTERATCSRSASPSRVVDGRGRARVASGSASSARAWIDSCSARSPSYRRLRAPSPNPAPITDGELNIPSSGNQIADSALGAARLE